MGVFIAICKFIIACIFCIDANTLPIDSSHQSIGIATCSQSFDATEANLQDVRPLDNVSVLQESLMSVNKMKETNRILKVSNKYIIDIL